MVEKRGLVRTNIDAFDLPDAWYQCIHRIIREPVYEYTITRGSYEDKKEGNLILL